MGLMDVHVIKIWAQEITLPLMGNTYVFCGIFILNEQAHGFTLRRHYMQSEISINSSWGQCNRSYEVDIRQEMHALKRRSPDCLND